MEYASHCHVPSLTVHLINIISFPIIGKDDKIIKLLVSVNGKVIQLKFIDLFLQTNSSMLMQSNSDKRKIIVSVFVLCEVKVFLTETFM